MATRRESRGIRRSRGQGRAITGQGPEDVIRDRDWVPKLGETFRVLFDDRLPLGHPCGYHRGRTIIPDFHSGQVGQSGYEEVWEVSVLTSWGAGTNLADNNVARNLKAPVMTWGAVVHVWPVRRLA